MVKSEVFPEKGLPLESPDKPKVGTHKKEGNLRPGIILGRIDLLKNQSVYPQGANSGSSLWVFGLKNPKQSQFIKQQDYN